MCVSKLVYAELSLVSHGDGVAIPPPPVAACHFIIIILFIVSLSSCLRDVKNRSTFL